MSKRSGWDLREGAEIVPGRLALKKLGGGKRYEVYLAWDDKLFSQVVVKIVRPDQVGDSRSLPDLEREVHALDRLRHPMLVQHFGAVLQGPRPHVVLELLEGPTLRKVIKSCGALPPEQLIPLAVQVGGVLHYMSTEETVHLDLKPSNIIMAAPPKLIDLSVARSFHAAARMKRPVGTRKYMSPEQCDPVRRGPVGPPADVWGLGATLYEAIAGRRAFETPARHSVPRGAAIETKFPQLVQDPPPLPESVPAPVAELILRCLERNPENRTTAAALGRSFQELLEHLPDEPPSGDPAHAPPTNPKTLIAGGPPLVCRRCQNVRFDRVFRSIFA